MSWYTFHMFINLHLNGKMSWDQYFTGYSISLIPVFESNQNMLASILSTKMRFLLFDNPKYRVCLKARWKITKVSINVKVYANCSCKCMHKRCSLKLLNEFDRPIELTYSLFRFLLASQFWCMIVIMMIIHTYDHCTWSSGQS